MKTPCVFPLRHRDLKATLPVWMLAAALICVPTRGVCGKLDQTRSAVRESGDESSSSTKKTTSRGDSHDSSDSGDSSSDGSGAVLYCLIPVVLPFCMIVWAASDENRNKKTASGAYFFPYPYWKGRPGRLVRDAEVENRPAGPPPAPVNGNDDEGEIIVLSDTPYEPSEEASSAGGRFWADYYYDLDKLHVPELSFLFDTSSHLGFDTNWRLYLEPLENELDKMWMGRLHFNIRFAQDRHIEARLGLGGRLMIDNAGVDGGFSSAFTFAVFPVQPLVITADMSIGNLGRALFLEGQITLGVAVKRLELFAGYRGTYIRGKSTTVVFHGPMGGMALWF